MPPLLPAPTSTLHAHTCFFSGTESFSSSPAGAEGRTTPYPGLPTRSGMFWHIPFSRQSSRLPLRAPARFTLEFLVAFT